MLYPLQNESRTVLDLSGIWNVAIAGKELSDYSAPLDGTFEIAVPGSLNDQVVDEAIRNHAGYFWYEKDIVFPKVLAHERKVLRFASVTHEATVYLNGQEIVAHKGGFTPFEVDVTAHLRVGKNNLKVRVSNILDSTTLPVGYHKVVNGKDIVLPMFDFYNYAGIHRPVKIYTTAATFIEDIVIPYKVNGDQTIVCPQITTQGRFASARVEIVDEQGNTVASSDTLDGKLLITETKRWQPLNPYLYQLKVSLFDDSGELIDTYSEAFGVRTISIKNNQLLINDKPYYLKGFGRHEDFPVVGKGLNEAVMTLDHNLLKWLGANSYRTSHYPYSEEEMRKADREGFIVIDEVPGVGLFSYFSPDVTQNRNTINTWENMKTHEVHQQVIRELVDRDKNHPSVIVWAIANEPAGHQDGAHEYFKPLFDLVRALDHETRPVVVPNIVNASPELDQVTPMADIICLNRYYGWYIDHGDLATAIPKLREEIEKWHNKYPDKPLMFSEFGVDTVPGMHSLYHNPYSEEYQIDFYRENLAVLDDYDFVIGEHLWNFADFATANNIRRIDGNLKGVFTRDRRPKAMAFEIKKRWDNLE